MLTHMHSSLLLLLVTERLLSLDEGLHEFTAQSLLHLQHKLQILLLG